jgi:hypothetical protein
VTADAPAVAEARRNAEQARARFWGTFDEILDYAQRLQDRLAPSHLARDAWEAAKSKGADVAEDAVDAVRKRPVAASSAIAALALFIAREPLMDIAGKLMSGKSKKGRVKVKVKAGKASKSKLKSEKIDE